MNIKDMSVKDLKALYYDELVKFQNAQGNLQIINQEIAKKEEIENRPVKEVKKDKK